MARSVLVWSRHASQCLSPILLLMFSCAAVLGAWTISQPTAPVEAWHKVPGQSFISSIRDFRDEFWCMDVHRSWNSLAGNGTNDWVSARDNVRNVLLNGWVSHWDHLNESDNRVNFTTDWSGSCVPNPNAFDGHRIRYHLEKNSQSIGRYDAYGNELCGWSLDPSSRMYTWHAGCVETPPPAFEYPISNLNAYTWADVYLDQGRICCLWPANQDVGSGWVSGLLYQHVNHETGHPLGLSDPIPEDCPGSGSIMHQSIGYLCWNTNYPVVGWDIESVRNILRL